MSSQGKGTYLINSSWSEGTLIFYEKAYGMTTTGNILKVGTTAVQVGDTANLVDFAWYATPNLSFVLSASLKTLTIAGIDVSLTGDLTIDTEDINLGDGDDLEFGDSQDVVMRFSLADVSNPTFVLGLDDTSQQMHITDKGAVATDWIRNTGTDPELAIHSNTTPATDYLAIGNHDGTTAHINVVGGTTLSLDIAGTPEVTLAAAGFDFNDNDITELGDVTTTSGSIITPIDGAGTTLLIKAGGLSGTTFITLTSQSAGTDTCEIDATTLDTCVGKGTWTASGTWTLPAHTMASTLTFSGGSAYIPIQAGVKANTAGSGFKISSAAADDSGGVQLYADDGGSALASPAEVVTPFRSRYLVTVAQSGGVSQTAFFGQLRTLGTTGSPLILNTGCWRAGYIFNQLGGTTIQGGAEVIGLNQATTLAGNMIVTSGRFAGIDINIAGDGTITNNSTCAALLIRSSGTPVWPNAIQIAASGAVTGILIGSVTNAINATSTTTGIISTTSACTATTTANRFYTTVAAANMADGYGQAGEFDLTLTGTLAGSTACTSSWVNLAATSVPGGNMICAQNNGIWVATGITTTSAKMVMGMRMQYVDTDGAAPSSLFCFSTNIYSNVLTAIFDVNALVDLGGSTGAQAGNDYKIPLFKDATANQVWYVNVYHT